MFVAAVSTVTRPATTSPVRRLLVLVMTLGSIAVPSPSGARSTSGYEPLAAPQRLLDTRPGESTVDGRQAGIGKRPAGSTTVVDVAGRAGLGFELGSVVLNVTVDQPDDVGFITVWPCDRDRPNASNVNHSKNQTVGVAAISHDARGALLAADTALYGAKRAGRDRVVTAPERPLQSIQGVV